MSAGEYGGRVLRKFEGGGKIWEAGEIITPEQANEWPYPNRMALMRIGKVVWYDKLEKEELEARQGKQGNLKKEEPKSVKEADEEKPKGKFPAIPKKETQQPVKSSRRTNRGDKRR